MESGLDKQTKGIEQSPKLEPGIYNRGGTAVRQENDRLFNCVSGETEYLSRNKQKL